MKTRKLFILIALVLLSLTLVACKGGNTTTNSNGSSNYKYTQPVLSNATDVVYEKDSIKITKADIYKALKLNGGMEQLLLAVDEKFLADKISAIDANSEDFINKKNQTIYGTDDEDEIAAFSAVEKKKKEDNFYGSLELLGYTTQDSQNQYIKVLLARQQAALEYMKNEAKKDSHGSFYYTTTTIKNFYSSTKNVDSVGKAIVINFKSLNEFYEVLNSVDNEIALFNGKFYKNPNGVAKRNYSEETLTQMTSEEVKVIFEEMYKIQYTKTTVEAKDYDYNKLQKAAPTIANIMFSLNENEYTYVATKNSVEYGDVYTVIYRTEGNAQKDWDDLTKEEKDALEDKFCEYIVESGQYTTTIMGLVRTLKNIEFKDLSFGYKYYSTYCGTYDYETEGDASVLVKWDGGELTIDEYFNHSAGNNLAYYTLYAAIPSLITSSNYYSIAYGDNKDLSTNASQRKADFTKTVQTDLNSNYSEKTMHFESVYLFNKYGVETVEDAVIFNKIAGDFQYLIGLELFGTLTDGNLTPNDATLERLQSVIDKNYDNYYKMKAYEFIISFDEDQDFIRDDGTEYDHDLVDQLVQVLREEIYKFNGQVSDDDLTASVLALRLAKIIDAYNDPDQDKDGAFAELRNKNYILTTNALNQGTVFESVTFKSSTTTELNDYLVQVYNEIISSEQNINPENAYIPTSVCYDKKGAHVLFFYSTEKKPSFKLTVEEDEEYDYSDNFLNEEDKMSTSQLAQAYLVATYKNLFKDATTAKGTYGVDSYPATPENFSFDNYINDFVEYYTHEASINNYYIHKLKDGSPASISDTIESYAEIFETYLVEYDKF